MAWVVLASAAALWSTDGVTSRFRPLPPEPGQPPVAADVRPATDDAQVAALPYANGRSFADLDAYLAHRRQLGAIDLPWYEEVAPGVFELHTTMRPAPAPRRYTRAELLKQFGFVR